MIYISRIQHTDGGWLSSGAESESDPNVLTVAPTPFPFL